MEKKLIGYLGKNIPIFLGVGVIKDKAETTCNEIKNAYNFLINERGQNFQLKTMENIKEIHLERNVENKRKKYDLLGTYEEKATLKLLYNVNYKDIVYCLISVASELTKI